MEQGRQMGDAMKKYRFTCPECGKYNRLERVVRSICYVKQYLDDEGNPVNDEDNWDIIDSQFVLFQCAHCATNFATTEEVKKYIHEVE